MIKYRKKPVVIEAMQWDGTYEGASDIVDALGSASGPERPTAVETPSSNPSFRIEGTPNGTLEVNPGEWVIKGVEGELYPCPDSIFQVTYEAVDEEIVHVRGFDIPWTPARKRPIDRDDDLIDATYYRNLAEMHRLEVLNRQLTADFNIANQAGAKADDKIRRLEAIIERAGALASQGASSDLILEALSGRAYDWIVDPCPKCGNAAGTVCKMPSCGVLEALRQPAIDCGTPAVGRSDVVTEIRIQEQRKQAASGVLLSEGSWATRLRVELDELSGRLCKLQAFQKTITFRDLDPVDRILLSVQADAMDMYRKALASRLERATRKEPV